MAPAARRNRIAIATAVLAIALVIGVVISAAIGQFPVAVTEVLGSLLNRVGLHTSWAPVEELKDQALWQIRFPRIAMAVLVGAALAIAGCVMQAIFGNPLAEPGVVGVSSGAALGAAFAIALGVTFAGAAGVAVFAFAGGVAATLLVYVTARANGRTEVVTLLLTGIAINAFAGAGLALMIFMADTASREQIIFWQLGSLNGSRWSEVAVVALLGTAAAVVAFASARRYDLLALGERTAAHLGVRVERLRVVSIVVVAVLTGAAVAYVGIIAFVGLVVPHALRMIMGPGHRALLPASALGGAVLLVFADVIARTAVTGAELPIGLITSLIGGPFFFYLLRRTRTSQGGWA
ncbi:FecCD family ABC transporter permease [Demequina sp.]|uniref:FecCD family ABC transporter permease n=1 Tax=Demequina sp. TaxID=2050685 RepID=UPI003D108E52